MAEMGIGFGSEWHLFHYLGRHRYALDQAVLAEAGAGSIEWLDVRSSSDPAGVDEEWQGIEFLFSPQAMRVADYSHLRSPWRDFWPRTGTAQSWDAVGILRRETEVEWLLVEAKAHTGEVQTRDGCRASGDSREQIVKALNAVGSDLGITDTSNWTGSHYQYANRLAALWFLLNNRVPARLMYVYFYGGDHEGFDCPATARDWNRCIVGQERALGIETLMPGTVIDGRTPKIFLPVRRAMA
ncbi:MAG: hypothetical protein WCP21_22050, partial [Armatimonadota bacterium]